MSDMDHDDDFQNQDKKLTGKERTQQKYGDSAGGHSLKENAALADGMNRKQRSCQDIICLIIFLAYVGGMIFITIYGFAHGNITKLLAPIDGNNNFCGIDDYKEYPNLYIGNLLEATSTAATGNLAEVFSTGVCTKTCPESFDGKIGLQCKQGTSLCTSAKVQYSSVNIAGLCLPVDGRNSFASGSEGTMLKKAWTTISSNLKHSSGGKVIMDIMKAKVAIFVCIGTGFVFSLILLYLMSAFAETIAWVCIFLTGIGLFGGSILCWFMRSDVTAERGAPGSGAAFQSNDLNDSETEAFWLLVGAIALAAFGCCFCVCVVCGLKHVKEAINVIDAAADFTVENKRVIVVPVVYFVFTITSFVIWLYAFACVVSLNKITACTGLTCAPQDRDIEWTKAWTGCALAMFFGILWIMAWWNYTSQFVVMAAATTYYFNCTEANEYAGSAELCYSVKLAHIYHTGSIACGAFIIALIEFIKFVFLYLAKKAEKASGGNKLIKAVVCVAECCLSCIEKICDYINQSAFAYIAVTGDGFCKGAWEGFLLNVKHMLDFTFANYIAKIFILLGKISVVVVNGFTLTFIMKDISGSADQMSPWGPIAVSCLLTYMIASLFLGIFENAVLALMTCYSVDIDLNGKDGEEGGKWGPRTFHDTIAKVGKCGDQVDEDASDDEKKGNEVK